MKVLIVKIGGHILDNPADLKQFVQDFSALPSPKILVHGGGRRASTLSKQLGLEPAMIDGRRVTDDATLEVVTMVYAGLINKNITALLQSLGCNAMGLSGADGNLILAHKRKHPSIDFGWVGDIDAVNNKLLIDLLERGIIPVIVPITHDGKGQLLNTNADTIAASIATALCQYHESTLVYCFEHKGLLKDIQQPQEVIPAIKSHEIQSLIDQGIISGGMIPKVHNIQDTLNNGVKQVILCAASDILHVIESKDNTTGTIFTL